MLASSVRSRAARNRTQSTHLLRSTVTEARHELSQVLVKDLVVACDGAHVGMLGYNARKLLRRHLNHTSTTRKVSVASLAANTPRPHNRT